MVYPFDPFFYYKYNIAFLRFKGQRHACLLPKPANNIQGHYAYRALSDKFSDLEDGHKEGDDDAADDDPQKTDHHWFDHGGQA